MLHNRGILEVSCYYVSATLLVEGYRMNKEIGFFVTLTGMALVLPSFGYSSMRHLKKLRMNRKPEDLVKMVAGWLACCFSGLVKFRNIINLIKNIIGNPFFINSMRIYYNNVHLLYPWTEYIN